MKEIDVNLVFLLSVMVSLFVWNFYFMYKYVNKAATDRTKAIRALTLFLLNIVILWLVMIDDTLNFTDAIFLLVTNIMLTQYYVGTLK